MAAIARQLKVVGSEPAPLVVKVAFATTDRQLVNQHFGTAQCLMIYGVGMEQSQLLAVGEFVDENDDDESADKLESRIDFIRGCAAVYSRACGASAIRRLVANGIQPVRVTGDSSVNELLDALQEELRQGPSNWLAKAVKRQQYLGPKGPGSLEMERWDDK